MIRRPPRCTRPDTRFPYTPLFRSRLRRAGDARRLMVMQASGGVMTKEYIDGAPIRVLASGPAGGVIGSAHVGSAKGFPNLLCVDMGRSEEHTSELQSLMRISYAVFCLKKKTKNRL